MKLPLISLVIVFMASAVMAQEKIDAASVTLSYAEFRQLLEAAKKPAHSVNPVAFAIHSASYEVRLGESVANCTATFDIQSYRDEPTLIPLLDGSVIIDHSAPAEATLVRDRDRIALLSTQKNRVQLIVRFLIPKNKSGEGLTWEYSIPSALVARLKIFDLPTGTSAKVDGALKETSGQFWLLGPGNMLRISAIPLSSETKQKALAMPPLISNSESKTRIVSDGTFLNSSRWTIAHTEPMRWQLRLGVGSELVSCRVAGRPFAPKRVDPEAIEIELPAAEKESVVELVYTGKTMGFAPVRGEFSLSLPTSDLLTETIDWTVSMPSAFEAVAIEGNCEFLSSDSKSEIRLRKEISRNDAPSVRVFYQKPETNTKKP